MSSFKKEAFISQHVDELWAQLTAHPWPMDRLLAHYYRNHRYLGAQDRRHISEKVYEKVRALPWPDFMRAHHHPAYDTPAPLTIRANRLKIDRVQLQKRLQEEGLSSRFTEIAPDGLYLEKRFSLHNSPAFKQGLFEVQDEASQYVSSLINPPPDATVLDACAGAGGKTLHLAALMQNRDTILATDRDARRLQELATRARRAGARNITVIAPEETTRLNEYRSHCDIVLLDAPCSGSGTMRRNPDLRLRLTEEKIKDYQKLQQEVLETYCHFTRPGGKLVYVTCSFMPEENEEIVEHFLTRHPEFEREGDFIHTLPSQQPWDHFFSARLKRIIAQP